ncbi:DUF1824 family protein [Cyanobium sp. N5-Cardenillas]|uniref:DUF1824 family protein n=1 Tax=Cyanobium sp. N5-Cardenillas TaxID=2823720 RepID=UPI0020CCDA76|nr:DUF1824 family protein [Cyanobium sp. N5-Cardenillas]MCP9786281.1 DUF1824 family protein [Cyanobium sp. N5-Cardenillas]
MTSDLPSSGLDALRGLRSAPQLDGDQARQLREELLPLLAACGWFTVGIMAPSSSSAVAVLRQLEAALDWPALRPAEAADGEQAGESGPVFLKGNQRTGLFHVRREDGLGEGVLITGQEGTDPAAEDTWGPLPLDLFA